ncbi:hypothetical protein Sjap_007611 [Stephania japonica]|uniref:Uncharacterized protein n=1 Tax=Stephania japonica TaxID=461633 RepID=A0AAP0PAK7_9MAGN
MASTLLPLIPNWTCSASLSKPTTISTNVVPCHISSRALCPPKRPIRLPFSSSSPQSSNQEENGDYVEDLCVPDHWLDPSKALQESEWLRVTLLKWLDDEYCPEETNIEISKVAARSFYESLMAKQSDLGEILLKMARDLESISYQESFHGAFSSANAAINLIARRIEYRGIQQLMTSNASPPALLLLQGTVSL